MFHNRINTDMKTGFHTGIVSVSFRELTVEQIIDITLENNLEGIEWGGDIHVPTGDLSRARQVGNLTKDAGLSVFSYGSYYRAGTYGSNYLTEFKGVLLTAKELSAPIIRIWAYEKGSLDVSEEVYTKIVSEVQEICDLAEKENIKIAFECHNNTLTDDYKFSLKFLKDIGHNNAYMYWQPNQFRTEEYNKEALSALLSYITNIHLFHWIGNDKLPLSSGIKIWTEYLKILKASNNNHNILFEFMPDGKPESLAKEVKSLSEIYKAL